MEKVGLADLAHRQIGNLSGGQSQRVFIARALAQQADFFFLDEPFVGIDMASEKIIIDILNELVADGKTIITVHHDLNKVQDYFDHLILLDHTIIGALVKQKMSSIKKTSNLLMAKHLVTCSLERRNLFMEILFNIARRTEYAGKYV